MKKDYFGHKKLRAFGGWHCSCCNKYGCSPRRMKVRARRLVRRTTKQALREESC